jgi:hypothetical protein
MLAAFVAIIVGALIIWIITEPLEIMLMLWLKIGGRFRQNRPRVPSENGRQFRCKSATRSERSDDGFLALSHNDFMPSSQNAFFS